MDEGEKSFRQSLAMMRIGRAHSGPRDIYCDLKISAHIIQNIVGSTSGNSTSAGAISGGGDNFCNGNAAGNGSAASDRAATHIWD